MSRYTLPNPSGALDGTVTTDGYHPAFSTLWAQSYEPGRDAALFRYGVRPREILTVEELAELLGTHGVTIPPGTAHLLALDLQRTEDAE
jgi:hypothetical protein